MLTWGQFLEIITHNLEEIGIEYVGDSVDPALLDMYARAALWALDLFAIEHTAIESRLEVTVEENDVISMPEDEISIRGIYSVDDGMWLRPFMASPEQDGTESWMIWYEWPHGNVHTLGVSGDLVVDYYAYHPRFDGLDENAQITVPRWAEPAIVWLTMANILVPSTVLGASTSQYKTRIESGNPEDNPLLQQVKFFISSYEWILSKHSPQVREVYIP